MYLFSDRFILTILNACICIFGDTLVQWNDESQLIKALFDNITHATIGCISAVIIISETDNQTVGIEKIALIGLSVIVSSLIDVDHFIVAKSIKLAVILRIVSSFCWKSNSTQSKLFFITESYKHWSKTIFPLHVDPSVDDDFDVSNALYFLLHKD